MQIADIQFDLIADCRKKLKNVAHNLIFQAGIIGNNKTKHRYKNNQKRKQ